MSEENKSRYTQAQNKATQKYVKNNYDRVVVNLPKGQRDIIKEYAAANGESMNAFIIRAINEAMER